MLVVTDGAVDLPPRLSSGKGVRVVPGEVWVGDEPFHGDQAVFWDLLRGGTFPSTNPPTVSALAEAYDAGELVCAVHVSADLSATMARGQEAAARVGSGVIVIDTRSLSVGAGMIAAAVRRAGDDPAAHDVGHRFRSRSPRPPPHLRPRPGSRDPSTQWTSWPPSWWPSRTRPPATARHKRPGGAPRATEGP